MKGKRSKIAKDWHNRLEVIFDSICKCPPVTGFIVPPGTVSALFKDYQNRGQPHQPTKVHPANFFQLIKSQFFISDVGLEANFFKHNLVLLKIRTHITWTQIYQWVWQNKTIFFTQYFHDIFRWKPFKFLPKYWDSIDYSSKFEGQKFWSKSNKIYKLMNETLGIHLNFESIDFSKY